MAAEEQKTLNAGVTLPPCGGYVSERLGDDCSSFRMHRSRTVPAMNERPAIAAVAIGRREEPAALPPQPAVSVAAIPQTPPDDSAVPADSAEVPAAAPATAPVAPAAKAARSRSRHVARREGHSYSGRSSYSPRYYRHRQVYQPGICGALVAACVPARRQFTSSLDAMNILGKYERGDPLRT